MGQSFFYLTSLSSCGLIYFIKITISDSPFGVVISSGVQRSREPRSAQRS